METKLCMIGAGKHARSQIYPVFPQLRGARVVANCDLIREKAAEVGGLFGIARHYTDWREMCDTEQPDGVMVCINDRMHAELAQEIMRAGHHVYVEKPHADSLAASRAMLEASCTTGRICMAAYKKRHAPAYLKARAAMRSEDFGDACFLSCYRAMGGNDKKEGGFLWEWGCHVTDLIHWLMGPVKQLQAFKTCGDYRATSVNLQFVSGACGTLTFASPGGNWEEVTVLGRGMNAARVKDGWLCTVYLGNDPCGGHTPSFASSGNGSALMGFLGEMQAFVDACGSGDPPDGRIAQVTHTSAIHEAIIRAIGSGRVEQVDREEGEGGQ